jgi:hypothetical protein
MQDGIKIYIVALIRVDANLRAGEFFGEEVFFGHASHSKYIIF